MSPPVTVYVDPHKRKGAKVAQAFAIGCKGLLTRSDKLCDGDAGFWGISRRFKPVLDQVEARGSRWYYLDNCYLGRRGTYFRVTINAYQFLDTAEPRWKRYADLRIELKPWRRDGGHVLVCPPGDLFAELTGLDNRRWEENVVAQLGRCTDREVRIRRKPYDSQTASMRPFDEDLRNAWALVTHSSNTATEALIAGVPVFVTGPSAVACLGEADLSHIESPTYPDRETHFAILAGQQWTKREMDTGQCWREFHER